MIEVFTTNDMSKLKCELSLLIESKNYKTLNVLLKRNPNTWLFNTRELNEEIPCNDKLFDKTKGVMKFEAKPILKTNFVPQILNNAHKIKQTTPLIGD